MQFDAGDGGGVLFRGDAVFGWGCFHACYKWRSWTIREPLYLQLNNKRKAAAAANIEIPDEDYAVPVPENVDDMVSHLMN